MRLSSNVFLIVYAIFLVFGIGFVIFSSDSGAINNLICAVSIASAAISLADLFYSKLDIDKSVRIQLTQCYFVAEHKSNYYMKQIEKEYGNLADKMLTRLLEVFNEDEIARLFSKDFTNDEQNAYIQKIEITINDQNKASQISKDVEKLISLGMDEDFTDEQSEIEDDETVKELLQAGKSKEKNNLFIANTIVIFGLTLFLVVLAWDNIFQEQILALNNVLTILAFLIVILNFLIKDNYRAKSLREIENHKRDIYKL